MFEQASFLALLSTGLLLFATIFMPFDFKSDDEK